jgi:antirestriction protein ArdC
MKIKRKRRGKKDIYTKITEKILMEKKKGEGE